MSYLGRVLVAIDQLGNALLGGLPDETISARAHRRRDSQPYKTLEPIIDGLFFWQEDHCRKSYESEVLRRQLPRDYSNPTA